MKAVLLFLFPLLEFYLLIRVGVEVGALNVVLWCVATAVVGAWVLKDHGIGVFHRMQADLVQGLTPQDSMMSAVLVFFAGALLILPGFITDAIGFLLLIPFVRKYASHSILRRAEARQSGSTARIFMAFGARPPGASGTGGVRPGARPGNNFSGKEPGAGRNENPRQVTIIDCVAVDDEPGAAASGTKTGRKYTTDAAGDWEEGEIVPDCEPAGREDVAFDCGPASTGDKDGLKPGEASEEHVKGAGSKTPGTGGQ